MAKTYVVKLEVDGITESVKNINSLETAVSQLKNDLRGADLGSAEFERLSGELGNARAELRGFQSDIDALDPAVKAEQFVKFGEGVAGGFAVATGAMALMGTESEEMEELMVKTQGAIAIAVGYRSIAEAKLTQTIANSAIAEKARAVVTIATTAVTKLATGGMKLFRAALLTTGIGAFVVAAGLLVAYWEDIKKLVTGVNEVDKKRLETSKELIAEEELKLELLKETENTLRLQGLTEREIRDRKREQVQAIINIKKEDLELQRNTIQFQIDAEARNQKIAAGIIAFMTLPITSIMVAVDALSYGLEKIGVLNEATTFAEDFAMGAASFLFDAEDLEAESEALRIETERALGVLENTKAGYLLQDKKQDEQSAQARIDAAKAEAATLAEIKKKSNDEIAEAKLIKEEKEKEEKKTAAEKLRTEAEQLRALTDELALLAIESENERSQLELEQQKERELKAIEDADNFEAQKLAIEKKYKILSDELAEDKIKKDEQIEEEAKAFKESQLQENLGNLQNILSLGGKKMQNISKALAIADVTRTAAKSVSESVSGINAANTLALATPQAIASGGISAIPVIAANTAQGALSIASTIASAAKSIQAISSSGTAPTADLPSGGGGGGGGSPDLGSPEQEANIDFSFLGEGDTSQVGQAAPVQAYVLESDVSSSQEASQVIKDQSTL